MKVEINPTPEQVRLVLVILAVLLGIHQRDLLMAGF